MQTTANTNLALLSFTALAFMWSWGLGFAATRLSDDLSGAATFLMIVAGFGPSLAGFAVTVFFGNQTSIRSWRSRCLEWRLNWRWFALAFLGPPVLMTCALALHVALGGTLPSFPASGKIPLAVANFGLVLLIGGPLGEEFGWRGYLMPALSARIQWRTASLVTGLIWGIWHLPLFYLPGTAQAQMPIPVFLLNILAGSVLFGWLSQKTRQSVLPALVLHTSLNAWAGTLAIIPRETIWRPYALVTGLLVLLAAALLVTPDRKPDPALALMKRKLQ